MPTPVTDWHARTRSLSIQSQAFVDGRLLARVASTDAADADLAVNAARHAFDKSTEFKTTWIDLT